MRFVRLLAVIIIIYGASYVQYGARQFLVAAFAPRPPPGLWFAIATNFNMGVVTLVIGIGLLLMKEWARKLWLISSIALFAIHIGQFLLYYASGELPTWQVLNMLLIVYLLVLSWTKLRRPDVIKLFH